MERLSKRINRSGASDTVPEELVKAASEASRKIVDPDKARKAFESLAPVLESFAPNQEFTMACGMLIEKQRNVQGMLEFWEDLAGVFPDDMTPLRMMMRWYRRQRRMDEGLERIHALFPNARTDVAQAEKAAIGLSELKLYTEIDQLMEAILPGNDDARSLRMRYIKVLNEQSRYIEAKEIADTVKSPQRLGQSSQELLSLVERRAIKMQTLYSSDASEVFERIIKTVKPPTSVQTSALGGITFLTGQLGAGGAERQMTRLATAFQERMQSAETAGGLALTAPIDVVVRHASPASGSDFFLPDLKRARVRTIVLNDCDTPSLHEIEDIAPEVLNLLELLPEDVFDHTCKLIPYFQRRKTHVAYLWQDGGVLSGALAALLAGVPRIITSFRGLPPNQRPEIYRAELKPLYQALSKLPQVTFSANSKSTAMAYESWLEFETGRVQVILNASPPVLPDGSPDDHALWDRITAQSRPCTKTVAGVFRFTENKRPDLWVELAAQYAIRNDDTRFILIGNGYLFNDCKRRIAELGLTKRIFLLGLQNNVGFFLHRSDMLLHLAKMEGLPNVIIEAQLAGIPVLATPAGGTGEVVANGVTGRLLSTAEDPSLQEIFTAFTEMMSNKDALRDMGKKAKDFAEPRFLLEKVIDRTARLFITEKEN